MLRPRSSLGLLLRHCGEVAAARLIPNQIEDELHFGRPVLILTKIPTLLFQHRFVGSGKWFRSESGDKVPTRAHVVGAGGDDSIMLEAIVLVLSLATCALILIAFWGLDLLRIRSRRPR
jgi:hypothetical protein